MIPFIFCSYGESRDNEELCSESVGMAHLFGECRVNEKFTL